MAITAIAVLESVVANYAALKDTDPKTLAAAYFAKLRVLQPTIPADAISTGRIVFVRDKGYIGAGTTLEAARAAINAKAGP